MTDETPSNRRLRDRLVALTRDLILIPSTEQNLAARRQCYEFVRNHVEDFDGVTLHDYVDGEDLSLVAVPTAHPEPEVLMVAHLDVVAHADPAAYRSVVRDGRIIGPGAGDMKAALAILMVLFRRFHREHPNISIGLAVTSDEETGGEHGIGFLVREKGLRCGTAIIPDGGALNSITVEEKGILHLHVQALGKPAHAARPWLGQNPIPRLLVALTRLEERFAQWTSNEDRWHPTCAITCIGTENETFNRLPADAHATLDIRFPPPHTRDSMLDVVREALGPGIAIEAIIGAEPTHLSPDNEYAQITAEVTGRPVELERESGGSDARFFHPHGIPVLMSRPTVGNLHAPDEWIDIDSMVAFYHILETYLCRRFDVSLPEH